MDKPRALDLRSPQEKTQMELPQWYCHGKLPWSPGQSHSGGRDSRTAQLSTLSPQGRTEKVLAKLQEETEVLQKTGCWDDENCQRPAELGG